MYLQKTYQNICGHTAIGALTLHTHQIQEASSTHSQHTTTHYQASLQLPIPCPFCSDILQQIDPRTQQNAQANKTSLNSLATTPPGSGLLCVLLPYQYQASPELYQVQYWYWYPLKSLPLDALTPTDWQPPFVPISHPSIPPLYTYDIAWTPRPCGEVRISERAQVQTATGRATEVQARGTGRDVTTSVWSSRKEKMTLSEAMSGSVMEQGSRMAGLMSQLRAAMRSGELAGRYG